MKDILKNKNILIIIAVIIVAFILYSYLFKKDTGGQLIVVDSATSQTGQLGAGKEILALLSDLKSLKLNDDLFKNKAFKSLVDFSLPVESEPKGRNNPFSPIGVDITASSSLNNIE